MNKLWAIAAAAVISTWAGATRAEGLFDVYQSVCAPDASGGGFSPPPESAGWSRPPSSLLTLFSAVNIRISASGAKLTDGRLTVWAIGDTSSPLADGRRWRMCVVATQPPDQAAIDALAVFAGGAPSNRMPDHSYLLVKGVAPAEAQATPGPDRAQLARNHALATAGFIRGEDMTMLYYAAP